MLKELHAVLPAADIQRARSFYRNALGFEPDEERTGSLMYHPAHGSAFEIYETDDAVPQGTSQMGWSTEDLDSEMAQLRARGVVFEQVDVPEASAVKGFGRLPAAKTAWFRDSEGNLLSITQLMSAPTSGSRGRGAGSGRLRDPMWNLGLPKELLTGVPAV